MSRWFYYQRSGSQHRLQLVDRVARTCQCPPRPIRDLLLRREHDDLLLLRSDVQQLEDFDCTFCVCLRLTSSRSNGDIVRVHQMPR